MAEARVHVSPEEYNCSICLELLNDPVTIPCGHNYCMNCIRDFWDSDDYSFYSCPQCRQSFHPRPVLGRNVVVAQMVERLRRTRFQSAHVSHTEAGPGDVACDVCTDRKYKAIKSCLVCLNSLCQSHLNRHESSFKGDRHCLIDATEHLQEMICPIHDELLEIFCHTDQMSICEQCTKDIHRNHDVSTGAARISERSSLSVPPELTENHNFDFRDRSSSAKKTFSKRIKKKVDDFLNSEVALVSGWVTRYNYPADGPRNRSEILRYSFKLSMDSNSVNEVLQLSGENRVATNNGTVQKYPSHPDRFDCWPQVLCKESVCGRAYWEVEWSGSAGVGISLAYKTISRKERGEKSKFGYNDDSMNLFCSPSKYTFWDSNKETKLSVNFSKIKSSRLGVYVDYDAGMVFYFSISEKMKLIHIVQAKFTQPLYPGFRVYFGSALKLCEPAMNCR